MQKHDIKFYSEIKKKSAVGSFIFTARFLSFSSLAISLTLQSRRTVQAPDTILCRANRTKEKGTCEKCIQCFFNATNFWSLGNLCELSAVLLF